MLKRGRAMKLLYVVAALALIMILATLLTGGYSEERKYEYQDVKMSQLHEAVKDNPLKARKTYEGTRIRVTGTLKDIDASGRSFKVSEYYKFLDCERIRCTSENDGVRKALLEARNGEQVTVCGKVSNVDGTFGYTVRVEAIER